MNWIFGKEHSLLVLAINIYNLHSTIDAPRPCDALAWMHWMWESPKTFQSSSFQNILNLIISSDLKSFGLAFSQVSRVRGNIVAFKWNLKSFIVGLLLLFLNHRVIHVLYNKTQPSYSTEIQVTTIYQGVTRYILSFCHYEEWQKQK